MNSLPTTRCVSRCTVSRCTSRRLGVVRLVLIALCGWLGLGLSASAAGPVVQKIDPAEGCVGQAIKLLGDNLKGCRRVYFLVGATGRTAKFKVLSNTKLEVIVPEFYRPDAEAILLVEADDGIAFTCPVNETIVRENQPNLNRGGADKSTLLHVIQGGVVSRASRMTVVETGGVVGTIDDHCPLLLLKSGGTLAELESHSSTRATIFYEPGAKLASSINILKRGKVQAIPVKTINLAEGVGPFAFQPAPTDPTLGKAEVAPQIVSLHPAAIMKGEILTIKGKGFSDTQEVCLVTHHPVAAGFRVISDSELRVEIPEAHLGHQELMTGHHELIIINSKGLTMTQSPSPAVAAPNRPTLREPKLLRVADGTVMTGDELRTEVASLIILVEKGGTLTNRRMPAVNLIKAGGTLIESIGTTYYEPGASVPGTDRRAQRVESIQIAKLQAGLNVLPIGHGQ